jgi:hypothetical protein
MAISNPVARLLTLCELLSVKGKVPQKYKDKMKKTAVISGN